MQTKITAMLIMARERRLPLLEALESCGIDVLPVCDCNEGRRILETEPKVQLVLTDAALPDGDWRGVIQIVAQAGANIEVVVCSRLDDHKLWIDVLEQGAYDVLVEPYQHEETRRIVEGAAARSSMRSLPLAHSDKLQTQGNQGTLGIFLNFKDDPKWADILELNSQVRSHPVEFRREDEYPENSKGRVSRRCQ
jgi:DNA-binding NtrC family response regulator